MCNQDNKPSPKSQTESKQISFYAIQQSVLAQVIGSLANTSHEQTLALLVEDMMYGSESQISQVNLGGLVGVGRQRMNEICADHKALGFLAWDRRRFGANVYRLPAIFWDLRFVKQLARLLPSFKYIYKKLKSKIRSSNPELSTEQATPIRIKSPLPKINNIKKLASILSNTKESLKGREVECEEGSFNKDSKKGEDLGDKQHLKAQEDSVHVKQIDCGGTPRKAERSSRMEWLAAKAPVGSSWWRFYKQLGFYDKE